MEYPLVRAILDERFRETLLKDPESLCKKEGIDFKVVAVVSDIATETLKAFSNNLPERALQAVSDLLTRIFSKI